MADASHAILTTAARGFTGQFLIDEAFLRGRGVSDFDVYAIDPSQEPLIDFFLDEALEQRGPPK